MAKVPFDQNHKLHRLLFVTVIVGANQGEAIAKILKDNEAYFCFFMHGKGTAPGSALEMLGLSDNRKSIVTSVVKEDRWPLVRSALESRFSVSSLAKGLAYAVPIDALMGISTYKMLSNTRFDELKQAKKEMKELNKNGK